MFAVKESVSKQSLLYVRYRSVCWHVIETAPPCYDNMIYMQYEKNIEYQHINTNESMHSEIGPVRQNPIQEL